MLALSLTSNQFFKGTVKIESLDAFPIKYHADQERLKEVILERGKKWVSLIGIHHKQFNGIAALRVGERPLRHNASFLLLNCWIWG